MKILIDIDESLYDAINQDIYINGMRSGKTLLQKIVASIANGTPIPDNATNGEIADMMFPDVNIGHRYWFPDSTIRFMDTDWWNSPYQKGGTSENNI